MKYLALALVALTLLVGCAEKPAEPTPMQVEWVADHVPTTPEEQKLCDAMIQKILSDTTKSTVTAGAIEQAKIAAFQTYCRPTLWEFEVRYNEVYSVRRTTYVNKTGRWKYFDDKPAK